MYLHISESHTWCFLAVFAQQLPTPPPPPPLPTTFPGSRLPLLHSQSGNEMIEKMFGSYCFYFQMLTSVPAEHTTVLPMVCATIPRDHLAVYVSTNPPILISA